MTTKNPKISGYVSQEIFDQFKLLCTDKGFSSSQGIGYILSEYFSEPPSEPPSGLPVLNDLLCRILALEKQVSGSPSGSLPIATTPSPSPCVTISWGELHKVVEIDPPKHRSTANAAIVIALVKAQRGEDWKFDGKQKNFSKIL